AIDSAIPAGAEHCLTIRTDPTVPGRYAVELTERHTDGTSITYKQDVTTADRGGKHVITSIGAAE
ncbi:MAG: hypothetical protein ICV72_00930, partial [Aldersonia sp.]|nr:hypothetical protein [Aldersonia sp.]